MAKTAQQGAVQKHSLQRLNCPARDFSFLLHTLSLCSFAFSFWWLVAHPNPINKSYGWHLQYLTIIGLSLATLTFIIGLLADLSLSPTLFKIKNSLSVASAPMAILISLLYWTLKFYDQRLVLPDWAPPLPLYADLSFHFVPAASLGIDLLLFSPPYMISNLSAFGLSIVIAVAYWFWVELCYSHNGFYPYPIFDEFGYNGRVALFVGSAVVMGCNTLFLKWIYSAVNGLEIDSKGKLYEGKTQ